MIKKSKKILSIILMMVSAASLAIGQDKTLQALEKPTNQPINYINRIE